jgi:hypothetical protein
MTILAVVLVCLALFIILCYSLEDTVNGVLARQRKHHERISTLEANEYTQDVLLDRHGKAITGISKAVSHQSQKITTLTGDVKEIEEDIGWEDDMRRTQLMKKDTPSDDDPTT